MVTAGIDIGSKSVKVVLLKDGQVVARALARTGFTPREAASTAMGAALEMAGLRREDVARTVATGAGRKEIPADGEITEVTASARGMSSILPEVRTLIDVGTEEGRAVKVGEDGRVIDFVVNDKCAAGSGAFTEAMARALEMTLDEFGRISLESERSVPMNAQCAVFAESEVVSLVHSNTPKKDIARAVHDAIASRLVSMVRRIGIEEKVALIGGLALNVGFHAALERSARTTVTIPDHPEYVGALGAALAAAREERPT